MTPSSSSTYSVPYYHAIYSHSISNGVTDGKKIHAPTFTPEIVTLPSVVSIASLPVQTIACDMRIKKEKSSYSNSQMSPTNTVHSGKYNEHPKSKESTTNEQNLSEPLALITKDSKKKETKDLKSESVQNKCSDSKTEIRNSKCDSKDTSDSSDDGHSKSTATRGSKQSSLPANNLHGEVENGVQNTSKPSDKLEQTTSVDENDKEKVVAANKDVPKGELPSKTNDCEITWKDTGDSINGSAINLTKEKVKKSPDVRINAKQNKGSNDTAVKAGTIYRKTEFSTVKRRSDKILSCKESKNAQTKEEGSSTGSLHSSHKYNMFCVY